ncbi:KIF-binding protein [Zeugodacus cucurbitae]|uniref:KIF-binding protein n=1 Tax=Zeugodacus cucurbitae TaxID=28588 RepID=UPI00059686A9|nr:KIF-binding protein [Zeugodacus cucurbitae]
MVIAKEILTDYKEVYEKAIKYVNEESKSDPPTDPFRSHYAARELLLQMKENLKNALASIVAEEADDGRDDFTYVVLLAFVCRDLGRIYVFTDEVSTGEQLLEESLLLVEPHKMKPEAIIPYVGALNEIGIVQANRSEYKKAFDTLIKSEQAYKEFLKSNSTAVCITDIFGTPDEVEEGKGPKELESLYTLCTFYLAQVHGHLGELEKSAQYCHLTLRRQLESKTYEPIDFALNAATLSQYFIGENMFKEARHHLAAATYIMAEHEASMLTPELTEQQRADVTETYKHRYADVARCWAKYGLALLNASKERLYNDDDEKVTKDVKRLTVDPKAYRFPDLNIDVHENRVTADYCLTFDDAKPVYHYVCDWLDKAKEYYKPETEATEYAKVIKDYAELYQHIAFFEEEPANQAKMQKRRAKYYEDLLELLNPVFYMGICRECWYGAGLSYCAILDIKLDALKERRTPQPQDLQKINQTCQRAIKNFLEFVKSYLDKDGATIKASADAEEQRNVLYAYFHLGRLHFKMITPDLNLQLENMNNSLKYYKLFTDECAARKEVAETLNAEVGVCREMVNLLPLKIANIKKRLPK